MVISESTAKRAGCLDPSHRKFVDLRLRLHALGVNETAHGRASRRPSNLVTTCREDGTKGEHERRRHGGVVEPTRRRTRERSENGATVCPQSVAFAKASPLSPGSTSPPRVGHGSRPHHRHRAYRGQEVDRALDAHGQGAPGSRRPSSRYRESRRLEQMAKRWPTGRRSDRKQQMSKR